MMREFFLNVATAVVFVAGLILYAIGGSLLIVGIVNLMRLYQSWGWI